MGSEGRQVGQEPSYELYIAVYECVGQSVSIFGRQFMRQCSILVLQDNGMFDVYNAKGTPGLSMYLIHQRRVEDPRYSQPQLLDMFIFASIGVSRLHELPFILGRQPDKKWNSQQWVTDALEKLVKAGLIGNDALNRALNRLKAAVSKSVMDEETPNVYLQMLGM